MQRPPKAAPGAGEAVLLKGNVYVALVGPTPYWSSPSGALQLRLPRACVCTYSGKERGESGHLRQRMVLRVPATLVYLALDIT